MIKRRRLLKVLPALTLAAMLPALAQPRARPARIAVLAPGIDPRVRAPAFWAQFHKQLRELGHVEGKTYTMEWRWDDGDAGRLPALAAELVGLKPDVIIGSATQAALALKRATTSIPIVSGGAPNPVEVGLVASLNRPGGNVTGISVRTIEVAGKQLQLLRDVAPNVKSVAHLTNPRNPAALLTFQELEAAGRLLGVKVRMLDATSSANVKLAFDTIARERIDGLVVASTELLVFSQRQHIVEAATRQRVPAIYSRRELVEAGGLMSYGVDLDVLYPRMADYAHRILQGTKPADLPYEEISTFKMVVNMKTAKALGLKVPPIVLVAADEIIQ